MIDELLGVDGQHQHVLAPGHRKRRLAQGGDVLVVGHEYLGPTDTARLPTFLSSSPSPNRPKTLLWGSTIPPPLCVGHRRPVPVEG